MTHRYDTAATRSDLIAAATSMFARLGYAAAGTEAIAAATGLTRGAMYHQFGTKAGLFREVVEELQAGLAREVDRRAREAGGRTLDRLRAGFQAYLDLAARDDVRQIVFIDGPAVLGWDTWHDIDLEHAFGAVRNALAHAIARSEIVAAPVDELTHALLGALTQASLEVGRADDPAEARRRYEVVVDRLLDGLAPSMRVTAPATEPPSNTS